MKSVSVRAGAADLWHPVGHPLHAQSSQVSLTLLLALGQGNVERLGHNDAAIHVSDCFGGFLRGGETHKPKA